MSECSFSKEEIVAKIVEMHAPRGEKGNHLLTLRETREILNARYNLNLTRGRTEYYWRLHLWAEDPSRRPRDKRYSKKKKQTQLAVNGWEIDDELVILGVPTPVRVDPPTQKTRSRRGVCSQCEWYLECKDSVANGGFVMCEYVLVGKDTVIGVEEYKSLSS